MTAAVAQPQKPTRSTTMPSSAKPASQQQPDEAPATAGTALPTVPVSRYVLFGAIASIGLGLDLYSKWWMFHTLGMPGMDPGIWLLPEVFGFQTSLNEGALWGMGQGQQNVFITLSFVASVAILYWLFVQRAAHDLWTTTALGGVMAGILGNLYDRLGLPGLLWNYPDDRIGQPVYAVRDWIYFKLIEWPLFNIADSLLVCGCIMLALQAWWTPDERTEGPQAKGRLT